jgi:hypothetical protein
MRVLDAERVPEWAFSDASSAGYRLSLQRLRLGSDFGAQGIAVQRESKRVC